MIGEKLAYLLESKKIKAGTLASITGIPKSTIYSIIKRDNKNVDFSVMEKISDALGVPVEYFYDKDDSQVGIKKEPTPESGLRAEVLKRLMALTQDELEKVYAFVQFLLASRSEETTPPESKTQ